MTTVALIFHIYFMTKTYLLTTHFHFIPIHLLTFYHLMILQLDYRKALKLSPVTCIL